MLLVHDDERQVAVAHRLLENRVRADQNVDAAIGETHQRRFARLALVAAGQDREVDGQPAEHGLQGRIMLAREDFGGREQRRLRPRLDRREHGAQRHQRLARPDIALQHPQHRLVLRHIVRNFPPHPLLRAGKPEGQSQSAGQPPVAADRPPLARAQPLADQHQCDLAGENLVIGQPVARRFLARTGVGALHRRFPRRPATALDQRCVDPFGKIGPPFERDRSELRQSRVGEPLGQRIDGLVHRDRRLVAGFGHMVGVHDLAHVAIKVEPPRDAPCLAQRKELAREARCAAEIDEADMVARAVERLDAERRARGPARTVILRRHLDDDRLPGLRLIEPIDGDAGDEAGGQVEQHIDHALQSQPR